MGAHPRSRGENFPISQDRITPSGSSPLTRGKHSPLRAQSRRRRLIPAHAGKTPITADGYRRLKAHPRSRGENLERADRARRDQGSSPLTRGKRMGAQRTYIPSGLIPAHAGKTARRRRTLRSRRAHPRSRRENTSWRVPAMPLKGPSPLTRGKLVEQPSLLSVLRLIPAHAGKTAYPASS